MHIIFDFDNTLYSEPLFIQCLQKRYQAHGIDVDLYDSAKKEAYKGVLWQQFRHMELLAEKSQVSLEHIHSAFHGVVAEGASFLYADVPLFLEDVYNTHPLTLLTYGEDRFQRLKIAGTGIGKFFRDIMVTRDITKASEVRAAAEGKPTLFVEDNPKALEAAKREVPHVVTVRVRRGDGKYASEPSGMGVDYEIKDLSELIKLI